MSTFQPSEYSEGYALANSGASTGESCDKLKELGDKYRKEMWKTPVFTPERQAYENKALAADQNYQACMQTRLTQAGSIKNFAKKQGTGRPKPTDTGTGATALTPDPAADAAAAALAAGESSPLPPILFVLGGVVLLGGIGYMVYKKRKGRAHLVSKKHPHVVGPAAIKHVGEPVDVQFPKHEA